MEPLKAAAKEVLPKSSKVPKHGLGSRNEEKQKCEKIHLMMTCLGYAKVHRRRSLVPANFTLRQAREVFGRTFDQEQNVVDENGFAFNESELDMELWNFSNNCALNVNFEYDKWKQGEEAVGGVKNYFTGVWNGDKGK
eukprot:TRINITY_DN10411_c0_g1_i2.p1 TRINITY_DN10411_c0_g1~~TRINITY_DN10411_c0_g1_i2.p1  ORF type:complete len:138 (-),score=25.89 TRINITY_DN10411_c0_g1_i2:115-528(-)